MFNYKQVQQENKLELFFYTLQNTKETKEMQVVILCFSWLQASQMLIKCFYLIFNKKKYFIYNF